MLLWQFSNTFKILVMSFLYIILFLLASYIITNLCTYFLQEYFIFRPKKLAANFQYTFEDNFEEIWIETPDNAKINGLWFKRENPKGLILYFHGNADNLVRWGKHSREFLDNGYDILMIDYRGFGKSIGKKTEKLLHSDARLAYDFAAKYYDTNQIILMGRSMGSGIASKLAANVQPPLLILETPFYSIIDLFYTYYPFSPRIFWFKYQFRNDIWLQKVNCPILIFHGTWDYVVPYIHAKKLNKLLGSKAKLVTLVHGFHKGLGEFPLYKEALRKVLREFPKTDFSLN